MFLQIISRLKAQEDATTEDIVANGDASNTSHNTSTVPVVTEETTVIGLEINGAAPLPAIEAV